MAKSTSLPIQGFRGESVPNRMLRPNKATGGLAVLLPGFGYTLDMPLFYYAENLLLERGSDILRVEYAYNRQPAFAAATDDESRTWLVADTTAALAAGLAVQDYRRLVVIGKSLGTLAMGQLLTMPERAFLPTFAVWLTPVLGEPTLRNQIRQYAGPSLFVIGTADPHYDAAELDSLQRATDGAVVAVPGADHGLDIPGDPLASIRALEQVTAALIANLQRFAEADGQTTQTTVKAPRPLR